MRSSWHSNRAQSRAKGAQTSTCSAGLAALLLGGWLLGLAACSSPAGAPQPNRTAAPATPLPTLQAIVPTNPPLECGPEAAIALAQTQSDLALAADSRVEAARQISAGAAAQIGLQEYALARDLMKSYAVPDCLLQAKVFADQFFGERIAAYAALGAGDQLAYEMHLGDSEIARQNMIVVVNGVLGQ